MQRFHLSQNNGSVCLHSEYPNWTVQCNLINIQIRLVITKYYINKSVIESYPKELYFYRANSVGTEVPSI